MTTHRTHRAPSLEYRLFFALLFVLALIPAVFRSVFQRDAHPFFVVEAWAMAQRATPMIFATV